MDYGKDISSVTVFAGAGFCNVENHGGNSPEAILDTVADSMANLGCITTGQSVVILSPSTPRLSRAQDGAGQTLRNICSNRQNAVSR